MVVNQANDSRVLPLLEHPESDGLMESVAGLIHQAANPYYDWFFGGTNAARAAIERQLRSPSSELAAARVAVFEDGDLLMGAFVALAGAELALARKADALATVAASPVAKRRGLLARMAESRELFEPVSAGDFYLSKIAVADALRGRGCGRRLFDAYLEVGRRAGFSRFRLDVSGDNGSAIALYRSAGFSAGPVRERAGLRYRAMTFEESPDS